MIVFNPHCSQIISKGKGTEFQTSIRDQDMWIAMSGEVLSQQLFPHSLTLLTWDWKSFSPACEVVNHCEGILVIFV